MVPAGYESGYTGELAPRGGLLAGGARLLLLAAVPVSLFWFPVAKTGAGTIAGSDVVLLVLWGVTMFDLLTRGWADTDVESPVIAILAVAIAALAALGSQLSRTPGQGAFEFMLHMKRFALAAIIPLAASRFRSPRMSTRLRVVAALGVLVLVAFTLWPGLRDFLPKPEDYEDWRGGGRAMGLGMNPNNHAYAAVTLAVLYGAFLPRGSRLGHRVLLALVFAGAGLCVVLSGSRSGLAGGVLALVYLLFRSRVGAPAKAGLTIGLAVVLAVGTWASPVFQERMGRVVRHGVGEENIAGRLEAQARALRAVPDHPFGVGYRGIGWASRSARTNYAFQTTDSLYLDTLLGAGVAGLIALLVLLWAGARHIRRSGRSSRAVPVLEAGFVAFLVFGAATIVPISVFLAPLYFTLLSGASHATDDTA